MESALEWLIARQDEDWIRAWDDQGNQRSELTAKSIATAAVRARDWLVQQDYQPGNDPSYPGTNLSPQSKQLIPTQSSPPPDRSDQRLEQPVVLLALTDAAQFLIWFSAVSHLGYPLFLCDPTWGIKQLQTVQAALGPHLIITDLDETTIKQLCSTALPVDNSVFLWEKLDFPQVLTTCGKWIDPRDHQGLSPLAPPLEVEKSVESLWIGIPTGGSSGQFRFAIHSWKTLTASVLGLQQSKLTDESGVINSCCSLPLHHVSGLMQFLRSLLSNGQFYLLPWSLIKATFSADGLSNTSNPRNLSPSDSDFLSDLDQCFLSLVPTQLQRLMDEPASTEWLVGFNTIFLGGAPAWPSLLEQARSNFIRLAPTYGMTETASQIITLHPDDFLKGQQGCGKLLPHAQVEWLCLNEPGVNELCREGAAIAKSGILKIRSRSLALGYYTIQPSEQSSSGHSGKVERWADSVASTTIGHSLITDDLGYCDHDGYIYIMGRSSDKIITGGENVFPAVVEAAILSTAIVLDVVVLGLNDSIWGERVVAVVVAKGTIAAENLSEATTITKPSIAEPPIPALPIPEPMGTSTLGRIENQRTKQLRQQLSQAIIPLLSPAQRPKQWLFTHAIPRNAQGKIQRRQLQAWAMEQPQLE